MISEHKISYDLIFGFQQRIHQKYIEIIEIQRIKKLQYLSGMDGWHRKRTPCSEIGARFFDLACSRNG